MTFSKDDAIHQVSASMRIGLYPGTFDPLHRGHNDIIRRGLRLVDKMVIGVAVNPGKGPMFSVDERVEMVRTAVAPLVARGALVEVAAFEDLLMSFAEQINATVIIRGLRAISDFEYEYQMVGMNRALNDQIEQAFLMADGNSQAIASKLVKEIARLDGDVSKFVSEDVARILKAKIQWERQNS
jgi:pantetheine-phosphate adenylyltransferase